MNTYIKIRAAQEVVTKSLVPPGGWGYFEDGSHTDG